MKIPISLAVMLKVRYWDTFKLFQFNSELQVLVTSKGIINEGLHQQIPSYIYIYPHVGRFIPLSIGIVTNKKLGFHRK